MTTSNSTSPFSERGENARKVLQRDPRPHLFRPMALRSVSTRNRIVLSPMCQYSATDGVPNDWHLQHLGARAVGGAGIVFTEVTHVEPRGRITPHCLGLWNDEQRDAFTRVTRFIKQQGALAGLQIGHAGRKASTARPVDGGQPLPPEKGGWEVVGPSAVAFSPDYPIPTAMDSQAIDDMVERFGDCARRAREAGFDVLEIHAAHGYLIHQFLSPIANLRSDDYGGSFENRIRLLRRVIDAVRCEWPETLPLFVRISSTDWIEGGWNLAQSIRLAQLLKEEGKVDLFDCSSGALSPKQQITIHPGYQVPFAEAVRRQAAMPTGAVGLIHGADMAEQIVANGQADLIFLGRAMLGDPYWPMHAARALRAPYVWPWQYERGDVY